MLQLPLSGGLPEGRGGQHTHFPLCPSGIALTYFPLCSSGIAHTYFPPRPSGTPPKRGSFILAILFSLIKNILINNTFIAFIMYIVHRTTYHIRRIVFRSSIHQDMYRALRFYNTVGNLFFIFFSMFFVAQLLFR